MSKQIFIDLETNNSLDPRTGHITQLAGIIRINGKVKEKFNFKNNIYHSFKTILDKYVDKFDKSDKFYFIGYNAKFDSDFIRELFLKNKDNFYGSYFFTPIIDVMGICAYKFMLKDIRPENFKLGTIARYFKIPVKESDLHDALYDIEITKEVYQKLRKL